ncbi:MAG: HlyD family efflux transporter periplasmic adaptor subunit, partial [Methylophagaceae bacterium]
PTQDQMIQLLGQLHAADLLQSDLPIDTEELFERSQQHRTTKLKQRISSPLAIKVPLWDPDKFLQQHLSKVSWLFNWYVGFAWLAVISLATMMTAIHWQDITTNFDVNALSPYNLVILVLLYPIIKFLHELGHAFSARYFGGEVHEMGISFLVFMPIPYVDVSTVNFLRSKHQRILVSAAGILVELFIAGTGVLLWLSTEPGLIKDIAFNMMIIGGISSLLFNGNPLLKYDGYYILADAIEIPNLFQRSTKYLIFLCQKYLFGMADQPSPASAPGEASWFVIYSISSFIYRISLLWFIITYITDTFFVVGIVLAFWMITQQILLPIVKGLKYIFTSPVIHRKRMRAVASLVGFLGIVAAIAVLPVPAYTLSQGVVWMPEEAQVRAETNGVASELLLNLSINVEKDTAVIDIYDPMLDTEVDILFAQLKELNTQFRAEWENDQVKAGKIKEQMIAIAEALKYAKKNQKAMRILTPKSGRLLIPGIDDLPGKFIRQGDVVGYVIDDSQPIVRVVVTQSNIGQIQKQINGVEIRLINHPEQVIPATIVRRAPEATNTLPSAALATINGGKIQIDPNADEDLKTQEKVFHIDLTYTPVADTTEIGQRVYVRFDHGSEPLGQQWYRSFRQVFLRQFDV